MRKYGPKWWLHTPVFAWNKLSQRLVAWLSRGLVRQLDRTSPTGAGCSQVLLQLEIRRLVEEKRPLPPLADFGFKAFSQTDEDGILLALFAIVGAPEKTCVEICAGDGVECNSANLILHHAWHGLLVDGDPQNVARGQAYYRASPHTYIYPPVFAHAWVTRSNVNELITGNGFSGDVGLLSIDMDGVDYWIWEAITAITPRVVVLEYQDVLGPDRSVTVPYADDFNGYRMGSTNGMPHFSGASLRAFVNLGRKKGYRLVAINCSGYNAFFLREDLAPGIIPTLAVEDCFSHPKVVQGLRDRGPILQKLPWVEV